LQKQIDANTDGPMPRSRVAARFAIGWRKWREASEHLWRRRSVNNQVRVGAHRVDHAGGFGDVPSHAVIIADGQHPAVTDRHRGCVRGRGSPV
jgi:hypothetical protein